MQQGLFSMTPLCRHLFTLNIGWVGQLANQNPPLNESKRDQIRNQIRCSRLSLGNYTTIGNGVNCIYSFIVTLPDRLTLGRFSLCSMELQLLPWNLTNNNSSCGIPVACIGASWSNPESQRRARLRSRSDTLVVARLQMALQRAPLLGAQL